MKIFYKLLFGFVLVVLVVGGGYYAWNYNAGQSGLANLSDSVKVTDDQVKELVARISKFLVVPTDENPSVVVLKDAEQLAAQQSFYQGAKDGDVLVVYSNRAIIYDVESDKLVNVGPIVRNDNPPIESSTASGSAEISSSPSASLTPMPKPESIKVDVRNGTTTAGLAGATASTIKKDKLFIIGVVGDAKGAYTETIIVDFTTAGSGKSVAVQELATFLKAKVVTTLPSGETRGTADALVIVGK